MGIRVCSKCGEEKDVSDFTTNGTRNGKVTYSSYCKPCNSVKSREWREKNRERNKEIARKARLKYNYGITLEEFDDMVKKQNSRCIICQTDLNELPAKHVHVDHCHDGEHVRGILCHGCNTGLGAFKDNITFLRMAAAYLEADNAKRTDSEQG